MYNPVNALLPRICCLATALLVSSGCTTGVAPEPPAPAEKTTTPTSTPKPADASVAAEPAPAHVAELRSYLVANRLFQAKGAAEDLRAEHPDDPWVMASVGCLLAWVGEHAEAEQMLSRALDLATAPNLRAEIRYYQALLLQDQEGFAAGREAVAAVLNEYPLKSAQRNLALIDGFETSIPEDAATVKSSCDRLAKLPNPYKHYRTCAGVRVGPTLWAVQTRVDFEVVFIRVEHAWYLAEPSVPEMLRFDDDLDTEPDENQPACWDEEVVFIDRARGLAGGVGTAEIVNVNSQEYLKFDCNTVKLGAGGDVLKEVGPSTFTRICSLESGWCTGPKFTHEVKPDGTTIDRTVRIVDGMFVITPEGGEPQTGVLP